MILEGLRNYHFNLRYCYKTIEEREHLGVADKFLIRKRFNQIIRNEALVDKIDIEIITKSKSELPTKDMHEFGIGHAGERIGIVEKVTKYF